MQILDSYTAAGLVQNPSFILRFLFQDSIQRLGVESEGQYVTREAE